MTTYQFLATFECFLAFLLVVFMCIDFFHHVVKKQEMREGILSKNAIAIHLVGVICPVCHIATTDQIESIYIYIFCMLVSLFSLGCITYHKIKTLKERKNMYRCMEILKKHNKELEWQVKAVLERFCSFTESEKDIFIFSELQKLFNQKEMPPETLVQEVKSILKNKQTTEK